MAWYSKNTLSVEQGSSIVTGTGTQFSTFVYPGFGIFIDGAPYEVASADSATQITLAQPYKGVTNSAAPYSIWPTQALNYEVWQNTTQLIETFGPLRNNLTLLNQQISDTAGYRDTSSAQAIAAAQSAADSASSATASKNSSTNSANSASASAASATAAKTSETNAKTSETNSKASETNANASKLAAASSAADSLTNKNATADLRSDAQSARDAGVAAQGATETARDTTLTAQGATEAARDTTKGYRDASLAAQTAAEAARDTANTYKNAAAASADGAATSETNAAADASAAQTAANDSATARDASKAAQTASEAARDTSISYQTSFAQYKQDAENARDAAEAAAGRAQEPVNSGAIEDALGGTPALLEGATFTGAVTVPAALTINPQDGDKEGGQITLMRAANQPMTGNIIVDTAASQFRVYDDGNSARMLSFDMVNGVLTVSGNTVYHTANLSKATLGLGNADNTSDVNKPVSTAQQNALNLKANLTGAAFTGAVSGTTLSLSSTASVGGALTVNGGLTSGDITTQRSATQGAIYLGSNKASYIYNDGTNFNFTNPSLFNSNVTIAGTAQHNGVANFGGQVNFGTTVNMANGNSYQYYNGSLGTDNKYWRHYASNSDGSWNLETVNDAYSAASGALRITRNGNGNTHSYFAGDITVTNCTGSIGQFQAVGGGGSTWYNTGWRNDGSTLYLMKSAAQSTQGAAQTASWDGTRPIVINLSNGNVQIDATGSGGTVVGGGLTVNNTITASNGINVSGTINQGGTTNLNGQNNLNGATTTNTLTANGVIYANANNGGRQSIRCGDDAWLGDANIGHTLSITSTSDANQGKLVFGQSTRTLGLTGNDSYLRWQGDFIVDSWLRAASGGGVYWEGYGRGINVPDTQGSSYGNINTYGGGLNGWTGYSIGGNDLALMSNLNDMRGLYSPNHGGWLVSWDNNANATFAANITAFSDERIKQNIRPIDDVWDRYRGLKGITYERDGKTRIGVGAQTTQKVFPEVVHENDDLTKTLSVNYGDLEGATISVVQMLMDKVEALTAQVQELERKLNDR